MLKISQTRFFCVLLAFMVGPNLLSSGFDEASLQAAVLNASGGDSTPKSEEPKKVQKKFNLGKVFNRTQEETLVEETSKTLRELIELTQDKPNSVFQTYVVKLKNKKMRSYKKILNEKRLSVDSIEEKSLFSALWLSAINSVAKQEIKAKKEEVLDSELEGLLSDDEEEELKEEPTIIETTLFNILLKSGGVELFEKVKTFIEHGADKNLHSYFADSPEMSNQVQHPFYITLKEIKTPPSSGAEELTEEQSLRKKQELRKKLVDLFLDDKVKYSDSSDEVDERSKSVYVSVTQNYKFILETLLSDLDFLTFDTVLTYLERKAFQILELYTHELAQIKNQVCCPILELVLTKMNKLRNACLLTDRDMGGDRIDLIKEFYSSKVIKDAMGSSKNTDLMFDLHFQERLEKDFEALFGANKRRIDSNNRESELNGDEFKGFLIEWTKLINFRNRINSHLNLYALGASNKGKKSNVIKLIRYAKIYDGSAAMTEQEEIFKELHPYFGLETIFGKRNPHKWTPVMYAMFQKQSEGLMLLFRQLKGYLRVTDKDAVDNNIFHLAFPLLEANFLQEEPESEDALDCVGANVGAEGVEAKTEEAIKALLTEREESIPHKDIVRALKQVSATKFTPISLAAATGYIDTYNYMVEYLERYDAFNPDDHAYLGDHLDELLIRGLKNYKKSKEAFGSFKPGQAEKTQKEIEQREEELKKKNRKTISLMYNKRKPQAAKYLKEILSPVMSFFEEFDNQTASKQQVRNPYSKALDLAIDRMENPGLITKKFKIDRRVEADRRAALARKMPKPSRWPHDPNYISPSKWKEYKKARAKLESANHDIPEYEEKTVESPLAAMKQSTSYVKGSYLRQIVRLIVEKYLDENSTPFIPFKSAYKAITGRSSIDYFSRKMNSTIEEMMDSEIVDILKQQERFKEERKERMESRNGIDNLGDIESSSEEEEEEEEEEDMFSGGIND